MPLFFGKPQNVLHLNKASMWQNATCLSLKRLFPPETLICSSYSHGGIVWNRNWQNKVFTVFRRWMRVPMVPTRLIQMFSSWTVNILKFTSVPNGFLCVWGGHCHQRINVCEWANDDRQGVRKCVIYSQIHVSWHLTYRAKLNLPTWANTMRETYLESLKKIIYNTIMEEEVEQIHSRQSDNENLLNEKVQSVGLRWVKTTLHFMVSDNKGQVESSVLESTPVVE